MALTQSILALSSVVVCDWCDNLFGVWLELGVPLGTGYHCHYTSHSLINNATSNIIAVPVKASTQTTVMIKPLYLKLQAHFSSNTSLMDPGRYFKLI